MWWGTRAPRWSGPRRYSQYSTRSRRQCRGDRRVLEPTAAAWPGGQGGHEPFEDTSRNRRAPGSCAGPHADRRRARLPARPRAGVLRPGAGMLLEIGTRAIVDPRPGNDTQSDDERQREGSCSGRSFGRALQPLSSSRPAQCSGGAGWARSRGGGFLGKRSARIAAWYTKDAMMMDACIRSSFCSRS